MMYPFMTLNDDTGGFHNATCWLPEGKWEDIKGYSDSKMDYFKILSHPSPTLLWNYLAKVDLMLCAKK